MIVPRVLCGSRGMCSVCDPVGFDRAVEREIRAGLDKGNIAGIKLDAVARKTAERYLRQQARARQAGGCAA